MSLPTCQSCLYHVTNYKDLFKIMLENRGVFYMLRDEHDFFCDNLNWKEVPYVIF